MLYILAYVRAIVEIEAIMRLKPFSFGKNKDRLSLRNLGIV